MNRSLRLRPTSMLKAAAVAAVLTGIAVSVAYATPPIEGVWSFNGGAVDIQTQGAGVFRGVVTSPTKFAQCSHPAGEDMWTEMRQQPDGSYFGLHQWYFEGSCVLNPKLGPTAWRVLASSTGARFLRVCFSEPGTTQPTIASNGTSANVTYGCTDSASIAPLPTIAAHEGAASGTTGKIVFTEVVSLPKTAKCLKARKRRLKIVLRNPAYDPLKEVVIRVNGHKVADVRGLARLKKPIVLRNLPSGSFKVKVLAITVLNQRLSGSRAYSGCKAGSGKIRLGHGKHKSSGKHGK